MCVSVCLCLYMCVCASVCLCVGVCVSVHVHMCVLMCLCICLCFCVCVYPLRRTGWNQEHSPASLTRPHCPRSPIPGKELVLFLRPRSQLRLSADLEVLDLQGLRPDRELARVSVLSTDSGIERDLPPGADELPAPSSPEMERAGLKRKGGIKKRAWPLDFLMPGGWDGPPGLHRRTGRPGGDGEVLPGVSRLHTARVLVLGDDRMLGRLAQAYHRLRWGSKVGTGGGRWSGAQVGLAWAGEGSQSGKRGSGGRGQGGTEEDATQWQQPSQSTAVPALCLLAP